MYYTCILRSYCWPPHVQILPGIHGNELWHLVLEISSDFHTLRPSPFTCGLLLLLSFRRESNKGGKRKRSLAYQTRTNPKRGANRLLLHREHADGKNKFLCMYTRGRLPNLVYFFTSNLKSIIKRHLPSQDIRDGAKGSRGNEFHTSANR